MTLEEHYANNPNIISEESDQGTRMRILKDKDRVLYDKLVRLAGGDSGIVISVLSNPHRSSVDLKTAITEIEALRNGGDGRSGHGRTSPPPLPHAPATL